MKVYTAFLNGKPVVQYTAADAVAVQSAIMKSNEFTVHDRWEKAERHGWSVRPMALVEIKRRPKQTGEARDG